MIIKVLNVLIILYKQINTNFKNSFINEKVAAMN